MGKGRGGERGQWVKGGVGKGGLVGKGGYFYESDQCRIR